MPDRVDRVLFIGSKLQGLHILQAMFAIAPSKLAGVITLDDRHDSRSRYTELLGFCRSHSIAVHVASDRAHAGKLISTLGPQLCVVACWYWIFAPAVLRTAQFGFIGLHNSLLPRFRGGSPLVWSLIAGGGEVGFSFFSMTEAMDAGPVWAQERVPVGADDRVGEVLTRIEVRASEVFANLYPRVLRQTVEPAPQNEADATFCASRLPRDGCIDWHEPAQYVHDFIRAQSEPYPGAFSYCDRDLVRVWKARRFPGTFYGHPGQVARIDSDGVLVVCGGYSAIVLEEVEIDGRRAPAAASIRSISKRLLTTPASE